MSEFEGMYGFDDCKRRLSKVIRELKADQHAIAKATTAKRMKFHDRFQAFIDQAKPRSRKNVKGLIEVARGLRDAILLKGIDARIAAIEARTAQLKTHTASISEQARLARDQARQLRLERAEMVVDDLGQSLKAIERLRESLADDADAAALSGDLADLVAAIRKTRTAVGALA